MSQRPVLAVLSTLALVLPAARGLAQEGPPPHHGGHHGRMLEKQLDELDLDAGQRERVDALLDAARKEREAHLEQVRAAFEEMRALLDQDSPDEAAVMRQADVLGQLRTDGHKAMLRTLLGVRAELTPEQRAELREKMREGRHHRRSFFKRWRGGPPDDAPPEP